MDEWKYIVGFLAGCVITYLLLQTFRGRLTELRRDEQGRIVEILERGI